MSTKPEIQVTLSPELMSHLREESEKRHVPLRWLVAGLVCDTLETGCQTTRPFQTMLVAS